MFYKVLVLGVCLCISNVFSHTISIGSCPRIDGQQPFDVDQFLGRWYIMRVLGGVNHCMELTFDRKNNSQTELQVVQKRRIAFLDTLNFEYTDVYTGSLRIQDFERPANMIVKWPANIIGSAEFKVVDTDYTTYALIHECQSIWLATRMSYAILSRETTLDDRIVNKLLDQMVQVERDDLRKVDHERCSKTSNPDREPLQNKSEFPREDENLLALVSDEKIPKLDDNGFLKEINWKE